jgi:hypothetical protein
LLADMEFPCGSKTSLRFSRHCERSEAIHAATKKEWIASSLRSSQ